MASADILARMAERIVQRVRPLRVVLFGSHARGHASWRSDIDLLVVIERSEDRRAAARGAREAVREIAPTVGVDIVVVSADEVRRRGGLVGTVLRPALHEGRVLYDAADGVDLEVGPVAESERIAETRRWLRQAEDDLRVADLGLEAPDPRPGPICYLAQQAAEKALKAVLVFLQVDYPFTHELGPILQRVPEGWGVKAAPPADLAWLSDWSYRGRYPGDWVPPTPADARGAVEQARVIYGSVLDDLAAHGLPKEE